VTAKSYILKNQKDLLIREAKPQDAKALLAKIHQVSAESDFLGFGKGEFTMTLQEEVAFLEKARASEGQLYLLAFIDDVLVGSMHFAAGQRPRSEHSGDFGITVVKDCWGLGIGQHLLRELIKWAQDGRKIKKIHLKVRTDNARAISLYERLGFELEGLLKREIYLGDKYFDLYTMALFLD